MLEDNIAYIMFRGNIICSLFLYVKTSIIQLTYVDMLILGVYVICTKKNKNYIKKKPSYYIVVIITLLNFILIK